MRRANAISADMKMCEHKFNVVTQDLKLSTLRKIMNRGSATLQNYIAKTNMKLGGLNYEVFILSTQSFI